MWRDDVQELPLPSWIWITQLAGGTIRNGGVVRTQALPGIALIAGTLACADEPFRPLRSMSVDHPLVTDRRALAQIAAAADGRRARGFEDEILRMEAQIPGLGGLFHDPATGQLVIYLKELSRRQDAMAKLRAMARNLNVRRVHKDRLGIEGQTVARQGKYSFSELVAWQFAIAAGVQHGGNASVDADEAINRVRVVIEPNASDEDGILRQIAMLGIPDSAVVIERGGRGYLDTDLTDKIRPVKGGTQIMVGGSGGSTCTLGIPVRVLFYNIKGWLTASHCDGSSTHTGLANQRVDQNVVDDYSNLIGYTILNPAWNLTEAGCDTTYTYCTLADAMLLEASDGGPSAYKMSIPVTQQWTSHVNTNSRGPRTLDTGFYDWTNFEPVPLVVSGDIVYKIGRTTGVTGGYVVQTCASRKFGGVHFLCMHKVSGASGGGGDSGGPYFYPSTVSGDPPYAIGIHSGSEMGSSSSDAGFQYCTASCYTWFSEWSVIQAHLSRYLSPREAASSGGSSGMTASIDGPSTAWQGAELTWSVEPSGGAGPFWYSWAGFGGAVSGSGASVTATPNTAGTIEVLIWDQYGNYAHASLEVSWCGQYAC